MGLFDRLFSRDDKGSNARSPEMTAIFEKIRRFMTDEDLQNSRYPTELQNALRVGGVVDTVSGASGEFGHSVHNPIPVNGPVGELVYLSGLVHGKSRVIGHRLGSIDRRDVYETVTLDGSIWDLLYLDPYYLKKSRKLPNGYEKTSDLQAFFLTTNRAVSTFPEGMDAAMEECTQRLLGVPLVSPLLRDTRLRRNMRPAEHVDRLGRLQLTARA